jgi:plastocyanin
MKRVLVAGVLGGLLLLGTPTLASSAQRHDTRAEKGDRADKGGSDKGDRGSKGDRGDRGDRRGSYGRHGYGYYYGDPYYGPGYDCYHDRSGYTTCEEYGGDYDPGGYNYRPPRDASYCDSAHSAHSAKCDDPYGENNGVPPGTVVIRDLAFNPAEIHARVGEDVMWAFDDKGVAHTVTADDKSFDSGKMADGEFHHRFDQPGRYDYHCQIHPKMMGTVIVAR